MSACLTNREIVSDAGQQHTSEPASVKEQFQNDYIEFYVGLHMS